MVGRMPLSHVALLAVVQGLSEALPISRSAHGEVLRLWLEPGEGAAALERVLLAGVLVGLAFAVRGRLVRAAGEGVRAVARPALFRTSPGAQDAAFLAIAAVVSLVASGLARPLVEPWAQAPIAVGTGLVVTATALASMALAPAARRDAAPFAGAVLVGLAHGLADLPGGSPVGAAIVALTWLGLRPARAIELSFLLGLPGLAAALARSSAAGLALDAGTLALAGLVSFLSAACGGAMLRAIAARKGLPLLALWLLPLGAATLAYARAVDDAALAAAGADAPEPITRGPHARGAGDIESATANVGAAAPIARGAHARRAGHGALTMKALAEGPSVLAFARPIDEVTARAR